LRLRGFPQPDHASFRVFTQAGPFPAAMAMKSIRGRPTAACDPLLPLAGSDS
jgi:hypothetical protein